METRFSDELLCTDRSGELALELGIHNFDTVNA